ncbi:MAG: transposase [Rhodobacteraceae bacterium]|nr:transposase [Paracoccaceae bacterium]
MGQGTKRRFSDEYKDEAVARLSCSGANYRSVADELCLTPAQIKTWHLERLAAGSSQALARQKADAAELSRLRRDLKEAREENDILRKASAFFAQWAGKT